MRVLLFLAALAACVLVALADPEPEAHPPVTVTRVSQRRLGFGGETLQKLVSWFWPGANQEKHYRALPSVHHSTFVRPGPKYGPPPRAKYIHSGPPSGFGSSSSGHGGPPSGHGGPPSGHGGPPSGHGHGGPPSGPGHHPKACNPCNKVPWIPIPHAQFQDSGAVFAMVNAPQLHQALHGNVQQPSSPVYHQNPLPQGYLPGSYSNGNKPESSVAVEEHVAAPSAVSSQPQVVPTKGPWQGSQPEVVQSVPLAEYTASIDYPIDVVQSPLIDLDASKSLPQPHAEDTKIDVPAVGEQQHASEQPPPVIVQHNNNPASLPFSINSQIHGVGSGIGGTGTGTGGGSVSYQNVNVGHSNTFTITPSLQTASGNGHSVQGNLPTPIPTQQQPPLNEPAGPFNVPAYHQPPVLTAPSAPGVFTGPGPSAGGFPSGAQRLPPIGLAGPQQPNTFLNVPPSFTQPKPVHPTRLFSSPGGTLRQLPPSAEGLSPPPLPNPSGNPYRFEYIPPSGNGLLHVSPVVVSTTQAPWTPSGPPPGSDPALIQAVNQQQNSLLDADASGLRSQWHHREINHQFQESMLVTVNATAEPVTPAPLKATTHILASDLRALLRKEQNKQQQEAINKNLLKLQHNIDSWTAQEFSNPDVNNILDERQKQATTAAAATLAPSKHIPSNFFSTATPFRDGTTAQPGGYYDHEPAGSISHNVHAKIFSKGSVFKVTRPKAEQLTTEEATTTDITTDYPTTTPEPFKTTSWEQVSLGFSKGSNEKVYVVTPMSTHTWTAVTTTTPKVPTSQSDVPAKGHFVMSKAAVSKLQTSTTAPTSIDASAFRSPRFTVRPTPGSMSVARIVDVRTSTPPSRGNRFYTVPVSDSYDTSTPAPVTAADRRTSSVSLDLTSVPTYSPPQGQNIQTTAGHSKVVTVVTSESSSSSVTQKKATRLSVKPVLKLEKEKVVPATKEVHEDEEEVVAAVREVSAIDLKRKTA